METVRSVIKGQWTALVIPESVLGPIRGDDNGDHRMHIAAVSIIRMALAYGAFKGVQKYKANEVRVSGTLGAALSMPAAAVYCSGRLFQKSFEEMRKARFTSALKASGYWVLGCSVNQVVQVRFQYKGWRWGLVEIINYQIAGNVPFRSRHPDSKHPNSKPPHSFKGF